MTTIVLVHGIAQEQLAAPVLESDWLPALAGRVANSGNQQLADRIWRAGSDRSWPRRQMTFASPFPSPAPRAPQGRIVAEPCAL